MTSLVRKIEPSEKLARTQFPSRYVGDLRLQTGYYLDYVPNWYADYAEKENFYEIIRKDTEVMRCAHLLSIMAAGQKIKIYHHNEQVKSVFLKMLGGIRDFAHAKKALVEKGIVFGLGLQKKNFTKKVWKEFGYVEFDTIESMQEVDRRRLRIEKDRENQMRQYWTLWTPEKDGYVILEDRAEVPFAPVSLQDYVWYISNYEEMSPYFEGYGDTLFTLCYIKAKLLQYWGDLAESWAKPFLTAQVDLLKGSLDQTGNAGLTDMASRKKKLIDEFEKSRARHTVVLDKSDSIQWHEHGTTGSNIIREFVDYIDKKIQLMFFGTELATSAGNYGSYALGAVHQQETDAIVSYLRDRLSECLLYDVIYCFILRNRDALYQISGENVDVADVRIEISVDEKQQSLMQQQQENGIQRATRRQQ